VPKRRTELSPAANRLLERVSDPRNWYPAYAARTPKAMAELVAYFERCLPRGYSLFERKVRR